MMTELLKVRTYLFLFLIFTVGGQQNTFGQIAKGSIQEKAKDLAIAVENADSSRVAQLIHDGVNVNSVDNAPPHAGVPPLIRACKYGSNTSIVRMLLAAGADVHFHGYSSLSWACNGEGNMDEIVKLLIGAGAAVDERLRDSSTPLMSACLRGNVSLVKILLNAGADVNAKTISGETALNYYAADEGNDTIISLLLKAGADVNAKADDGWTALMNASASRSEEGNSRNTLLDAVNVKIVRMLLKASAEYRCSE